jgi:hypothetical protein
MDNERKIKLGHIYKHFKGKEYLVLYIAKHSETLEDVVVYQQQYGEMGIWVRPLSMFMDKVTHEGEEKYRFEEAK